MAAKLLHSLTDDNPDLQKQIGCMTGIFQMFDRQPIFTGRSGAHASKRPPHNGNSSLRTLERDSSSLHIRSASREKYSQKYTQEKQRLSIESSRPSFSSSSRSSSFSSLDCNRGAHLESPSRDPEMSMQSSSPQFSRPSLDIRDFVKESMYRDVNTNTLPPIKPKATDESSKNHLQLNKSLKARAKIQEVPVSLSDPRVLQRSASYHVREGSSFSASRDIAPRFSYDGRDSREFSKSTLVKLKDIPRLSLDSSQTRPPSVVAKLMGLETLPDSIPSSSDTNSVLSQSFPFRDFVDTKTDGNSIQKSLRKDPGSPRWRNSEPSKKPVLRFPIEPAPWKHIDSSTKGSPVRGMRAPVKESKILPSVYSEIEKRLKDLEFTESGKDLRALKQILEAMQSKGFLETKKEVRQLNDQTNNLELRSVNPRTGSSRNQESPIVIMKPANRLVEKPGLPVASVTNYTDMKNDRTTKTSQTSSRLAKDSNGKSGSLSPRMQQKKLELEKRSRPPTPPDPSKSRRQLNKQQSETNSPGGRRRLKQTSDVSSEIESSVHSNESIIRGSKNGLERSTDISSCQSLSLKASKFVLSDVVDKKSTQGMSEEDSFVPPEHSSPVSVLDKVVCKDDSPSPAKNVGKIFRDKEKDSGVVQDYAKSSSTSEINRKKLQNVENLVQKLRRLNSTHDEARTDYIASLCENSNPDHRYVSEILLASGLLLRELGSSLTNFQFHSSGHPINPELFLVLEQTKASNLLEGEQNPEKTKGKFNRKLIFDAVNEILARKLASEVPGRQIGKRDVNANKLLRELCSEIELLQAKNPKCGSDDGWRDILCEDVMHEMESWTSFDDDVSGAVLDIERSIFKDLVDEIVIGEASAGVKTRPGRRRLFASS